MVWKASHALALYSSFSLTSWNTRLDSKTPNIHLPWHWHLLLPQSGIFFLPNGHVANFSPAWEVLPDIPSLNSMPFSLPHHSLFPCPILFFFLTFIYSPPECQLHESKDFVFCSLMNPQGLEQNLAHSKCSINIYWMNKCKRGYP